MTFCNLDKVSRFRKKETVDTLLLFRTKKIFSKVFNLLFNCTKNHLLNSLVYVKLSNFKTFYTPSCLENICIGIVLKGKKSID